MKIAIHHSKGGFSSSWISYCQKQGIDYKVINCYESDIVTRLSDCDALMWHFHHANCRDVLFAKQLIYSLESAGMVVFPDFHTCWHFDDKVGQMYLLKSVGAPVVPTYIFYEKGKAYEWAENAVFPKVFKLRTGSGSSHVRLVSGRKEARKFINKAFGKGFKQYEPRSNLKERWRKYRAGKSSLLNILKGMVRFGYTTDFDRIVGNEKGYVYFQDFIPDNEFDIRVIVIDNKAFAIKRLVRENDFRASGSGFIEYGKENFDNEIVQRSFELTDKLKSSSLVLDYIFDGKQPLISEISYGFTKEGYEQCEGYWNKDLTWHEGLFNPQGWMVESVIQQIREKNRRADIVEPS